MSGWTDGRMEGQGVCRSEHRPSCGINTRPGSPSHHHWAPLPGWCTEHRVRKACPRQSLMGQVWEERGLHLDPSHLPGPRPPSPLLSRHPEEDRSWFLRRRDHLSQEPSKPGLLAQGGTWKEGHGRSSRGAEWTGFISDQPVAGCVWVG